MSTFFLFFYSDCCAYAPKSWSKYNFSTFYYTIKCFITHSTKLDSTNNAIIFETLQCLNVSSRRPEPVTSVKGEHHVPFKVQYSLHLRKFVHANLSWAGFEHGTWDC